MLLGSFCISSESFFKLLIIKAFQVKAAIAVRAELGRYQPIMPLAQKDRRNSATLYLRTFSKQSLPVTQWAASSPPVRYRKVI